MNRQQRRQAERELAKHPELAPPPVVEIVPDERPPFCLADSIGRVSWIEALGLDREPAGDCHGDLYELRYVKGKHLCERHLLQYNLDGRKLLASKVRAV